MSDQKSGLDFYTAIKATKANFRRFFLQTLASLALASGFWHEARRVHVSSGLKCALMTHPIYIYLDFGLWTLPRRMPKISTKLPFAKSTPPVLLLSHSGKWVVRFPKAVF